MLGGVILFSIFIHFSKVDPLYLSFNLVVFSLYFLEILSSLLSAVLVLVLSEMLVLWLLLLLRTDPSHYSISHSVDCLSALGIG